ncbi:MAG: hypothetical protein AAGK21_09270 [Bacteroidota bacterium]
MSNVETIHVVHHCHTDIGYTHDPPVVWDLQDRFIQEAVDLAERDVGLDADHAFRWTVETTESLRRWLAHASAADIDRFCQVERAGRIEVTGLPLNLTPLTDADQLAEALQGLRTLRQQHGLTIRHAMNCDVNGQAWPVADLLLDAGIRSLSMAINSHMGGTPPRPDLFWWEAPSGRRLLTLGGFHYMWGWRFGIGRSAESLRDEWWPRVDAHLDAIGYGLRSLLLQTTHPFGDNGTGDPNLSAWIEAWNTAGGRPRILLSTPSEWVDAVLAEEADLPVRRGEWTDFWNFGAGSSAREVRVNRASRDRLRTADALVAAVGDEAAHRSMSRYRDAAWRALHLFDEHTWGVDTSISAPHGEDTTAQWMHKAHTAWEARSLSLMLQRDALAALAARVPRPDPSSASGASEAEDGFSPGDGVRADDVQQIVVVNPLSTPIAASGPIAHHVLHARGTPEDQTAGRHFQDHGSARDGLRDHLDATKGGATQVLLPTEVPAFGYAVVPRAQIVPLAKDLHESEEAEVEAEGFRLSFDLERGGITSLVHDGHEWVDPDADWTLGGFIHEEVDDRNHDWARRRLFEPTWNSEEVELPSGWQPDWPARRRGAEVAAHRVFHTPLGVTIVQHLRAPDTDGLIRQRVDVRRGHVAVETAWEMTTETHPEATYLAFPLALPGATARWDGGGLPVEMEADQLPDACRDFATVQRWVDLEGHGRGITLATPDAPLVQLGGFTFAKHIETATLDQAHVLGWPTNTYWETNFRASQPGRVVARYRLAPYRGAFDEQRAHRVGIEASHAAPLVQHLGEPTHPDPFPDPSASLLRFPGWDSGASPVLTLHVQPGPEAGTLDIRLLNASDTETTTEIASGALRILAAHATDLFGTEEAPLAVRDGSVEVTIDARRLAHLRLRV